ncbi:cytochrome P450 [Halorientalis halophila]|uniref:cytochrome P450 n=1 Tax=Halorientalis halophila TaxID=3108499 RepID=UPI00300BC1C3
MSQTPPGPKGRPVFGSSRQYARDPFAFVTALERAYGGIAQFDMGPMETYAVTDPEAIEEILVTQSDAYEKPDFQADAIGDLLGEGLLLSEGETWERQRELANPAFDMNRLSGMADRITGHAESMVDGWTAGDEIDAEMSMTEVTLRVILDVMMGVRPSDQRIEHVREQLEPLGERFEPDPIRFALPDWVPMPGDAEFAAAVAELEEIIDGIVRQRRTELAEADDPDAPMDFLSILLRAREEGTVTDEQLRDEMMTMLLAGHDTTALTLTYTWYLLSEHPEVERRVHAELDEVLGDGQPTMADVRKLEYTTWTIEEAMRLYPPVYAIFRSPTRPVEILGYTIPTDASIMLPQWAVHRSDEYWEEPEVFDPERFSPERRAERPRFAYFPFGGGPRHCIGKHLAMLEARLIVATVADRYRLEFLGESPLELLPTLTAHPRQEMSMRVVPRE